jgi:hypothetical protein
MLVCSVSQLQRRAAVAADVAEAAAALDAPGTGNVVFATLVDDPASVGDTVDAYLGEIMLEAASAGDAADAGLAYAADLSEPVTAADVSTATISTVPPAAPTIESHNHSISSGGTTTTIAVNASGAGRVIVVCATIGTASTIILPTATISSGNPNIGSWVSIGHMPVTASPSGLLIQAWYAVTSGAVSAATVTVTAGATIDDAALAYVTVAGANTAAPLDQNSTLATGSSNGSSAKELNVNAPMRATISTNNADTLVFTLVGTTANRTYTNPTSGTTLTEFVLNGGGSRFAAIGVYTAPFTTQQSGTNVGSTDSNIDPLFAFALTQ